MKAFLISLLAAALLLPVGSSAATVHPAKKLKACKKGSNAKKCRCPKGQKLVKKGRKYRCQKKKAPQQQGQPGGDQGTGGNTDPGTGGNTDPGTGGDTDPGTGTPQEEAPPAPPANTTFDRNDAAFEQALSSTMLRQYDEGTYGYGRYAYNFLSDHQLLYCSYYYAGSTVEANKVGTWQVVEGYTTTAAPGYTAGKIRITGSDFDVLANVEMLGNKSNVDTGNASNTFAKGAFSRAANGAVTNCSSVP